ncbi:hypothetical protein C8R44DRAFT_727447 [Mycena epipterygia]|nr:hypothetical protein C8R44DRAFT_727447 [Mycena epipterygia]
MLRTCHNPALPTTPPCLFWLHRSRISRAAFTPVTLPTPHAKVQDSRSAWATRLDPSGLGIVLVYPHSPSMLMAIPPPMKAITSKEATTHELKLQQQAARNEKAHLRMARKRAELRARPLTEQEEAAECSRAYQATYHENVYKACFGQAAYVAYAKA